MTAFVLILLIAQAAALLWASVQLSNIFLRADRFLPLVFALSSMAVALALGRFGVNDDSYRILCTTGDALVLVLIVAGVRVVAMNKESERFLLEARLEATAAREAARAARKAEAEAYVQAAAAALEAKKARPISQPRTPPGHSPLSGRR